MNVLRAFFIIAIWICNFNSQTLKENKNFVQIVNEVGGITLCRNTLLGNQHR